MRPNARRLGAALLALVFGAVGVVTLVRYVRTAEDRALAGQQLVDVMVVTQPVEAGTPVDDLTPIVEIRQVPSASRTPGALADLEGYEDLVTSVDLVPGEQLLAARFESEVRRIADSQAAIPEGLVEVTIQVDPTRAVGGQITPGDLVAVIASINSVGEINEAELDVPPASPVSGVLLRQALVTNVQSAAPESLVQENDRSRATPPVNLLVTFALTPAEAERLVFGAEYGRLWLARESEGEALESGTLTSYNTVFDGLLAEIVAAAAADAETSEASDEETEEAAAPEVDQ